MIICAAKVILYQDTPVLPKVIHLRLDAKQLIIHAVVCWLIIHGLYSPNLIVRLYIPRNFWSENQTIFGDDWMIQLPS
jgi:hypothetical protein